MIVLSEEVKGKKSWYQRIIADEDGVIVTMEKIDYRTVHVKKDGTDYFVLYDQNMIPIQEAFRFLNFNPSLASYNSREQALYALKLLYSFCALTKSDINNLKEADVNNLIYFLIGYSPSKGSISMDLITDRRNKTVNDYLSIYRSYFRFNDMQCEYLMKDKATTTFVKSIDGGINSVSAQTMRTYNSSLKTGTPEKRVPKYISVEEFERLIAIVREDHNVQAEIMIRFMYEFGLRLGELLGLTNEDITERKVNGKMFPVVYLRNRTSDNKKTQSAKLKEVAVSKEQYSTENYNTEKIGYEKVYITRDFYELLNEYIEQRLMVAHKNKRLNRSVADKVTRGKYAPENHYIFLNSLDAPMSPKTWNSYLKKIYRTAGIDVHQNKKDNLSHRLRHGFAMFQVKYRNIDVFRLKNLMRHSAISSTMVYYNPTEEDEFNIKTEFVEDIYEMIPALKEKPELYD